MTREELLVRFKFELLMNDIDLIDIIERYECRNSKWIAIDENGEVWVYQFKPQKSRKHKHWQLSKKQQCNPKIADDNEGQWELVELCYILPNPEEDWEVSLFSIKELLDD